MGKDKNPRRVADNEAMAKLRMLKTSLIPSLVTILTKTNISGHILRLVTRDKLKAEDSLRLLFSWLQIPITMPPVPEKSPLFLESVFEKFFGVKKVQKKLPKV